MKNVKRRDFLKMASALSAGRVLPVGFGLGALTQQAHADGPDYSAVNVEAPAVMPQVINVFLYGGASELAGNLSNIVDINANSVNSYTDSNEAFGPGIVETEAENPTGYQVTANGCWKDAGGTHMEDMLVPGGMTIYRTIYKQKRPTRSHRESIFMSHKGSLDIENSPGIGSRIAHTMLENRAKYEGAMLADDTTIGNLDEMILPFVSFEGETQTYALDPSETLPLYFRGLTMDQNFDNPYSRSGGEAANSLGGLDALVEAAKEQQLADGSRYKKAAEGFKKREELDARMIKLQELSNATLPGGVIYPVNSFADQLRSVVTLAIHNPETLYMAVGTPGLGGWDNHNNGVDSYPNRMNQLMEALQSAMQHIEASQGVDTIGGAKREHTDNIVINVFGDFGRLVNLNDSKGWDHANNQNLYTFGGAGVRPPKEADAMGKIVGKTQRQGTSKTNNQYTVPTSDSVTFEPMCIASSIYGYFGVQNPQVLTASEGNESGDGRLEDGLPEIGIPLS